MLTIATGIIFVPASGSWQTLGAAVIATTSLQVGYIAGLGIHSLMAGSSGTARALTASLTVGHGPAD